MSAQDSVNIGGKDNRVGIYISGGLGGGQLNNLGGLALDLNCSFKYKSHMITYSQMGCSPIYLFGAPKNSDAMGTKYKGILFGEAYRTTHIMLSLSAGLGYTNQSYDHYVGLGPYNGYYINNDYNGLSCPIEVNIFSLNDSVLGGGLHFSLNLIPGYCSYAI